MVTFTILFITAIILAIFTALALIAGGGIFIVMFGDLVVFVVVTVFIIKRIIKRT